MQRALRIQMQGIRRILSDRSIHEAGDNRRCGESFESNSRIRWLSPMLFDDTTVGSLANCRRHTFRLPSTIFQLE